MQSHRHPARLITLVALSFVTVLALSTPGAATIGNIAKSDLQGSWTIALRGNTGCGFVDMQVNVTLNSSATGAATLATHGQCGNSTLTGQTFNVSSLAANGSGTAGLSCGVACGWTFKIQVAPDRSKFSLVDDSDASQFLEGTGVLTSPNGDLTISDLTGGWQVTLYGIAGCGNSSVLATFALPSSGTTTSATISGSSSSCGISTSSGNTFQIQSLNPNGSGTAFLSCGVGCGWNFDIQVSPDRSTFNLVDLTNGGNFLAGVAINCTTAANVSLTNLAGVWELALDGFVFPENGFGTASAFVTFTLNSTGKATNASETLHTALAGNSTLTAQTFTVLTLNEDGSGTASLTGCAEGGGTCVFAIQVAADRSTFNVVDVSDSSTLWGGTATHR
jgi:hypothetical protein